MLGGWVNGLPECPVNPGSESLRPISELSVPGSMEQERMTGPNALFAPAVLPTCFLHCTSGATGAGFVCAAEALVQCVTVEQRSRRSF